MSEMSTRSVDSHTNIRAVAAIAPEADKEKVIEFRPGLRLRDFYNFARLHWAVSIKQSMYWNSQVDRTLSAEFWHISWVKSVLGDELAWCPPYSG